MDQNQTRERLARTRFLGLRHLIGNTPLLKIRLTHNGKERVIYAKSENMNLTASIKDRMALHIMQHAYATGQIKPGDTIVEATSGNTGIAFSAIGRALGHPVTIFMPDWMSQERIQLIRSLGAKVVPVSHEEGGFVGCIEQTEEYARENDDIFLPCQFANQANVKAHEETTGPEIWWQLSFEQKTPDAFVAGVGTGGTVTGVGRFLRQENPSVKIHPLEPAESPTLTTGHQVGEHRIQGISDEFIPAIVNLSQLDDVVRVSDGDSILMAQKLSAQLGLAVGISSGANLLGALKVQEELGGDAVVATVFSDCNKKYLSTDLLREEPVKDHDLAPAVELKGFRALKRVCLVCCDAENCNQRLVPMPVTGG